VGPSGGHFKAPSILQRTTAAWVRRRSSITRQLRLRPRRHALAFHEPDKTPVTPPGPPFESRGGVLAWERRAAVRSAVLAEATKRMLDAVAVGPGGRVLDVGTGTGDTALLVDERVGPAGHILVIDASRQMIEQGYKKIRESALSRGR